MFALRPALAQMRRKLCRLMFALVGWACAPGLELVAAGD